MAPDLIWFNSYDEFDAYVKENMANAEVKMTSIETTIRTKHGTVIAKWNIDGHGQAFEKRSKERLEKERGNS